jgi:oxygen-independent coproporphyrinogen-3 oxidase
LVVQWLNQDILIFLTSIRNAKQVFKTFDNARGVGLKNISYDLIYGISNQTSNMWTNDLNHILHLETNNISAYNLTVDNRTKLFEMVKTKKQNSLWW